MAAPKQVKSSKSEPKKKSAPKKAAQKKTKPQVNKVKAHEPEIKKVEKKTDEPKLKPVKKAKSAPKKETPAKSKKVKQAQKAKKKLDQKPKQTKKAPTKVSDKFTDWLESWEGEQVSKQEITNAEKSVVDNVPEEWRQEQHQFDALVSIAHDSGPAVLTSPHNSLGRVLKTKHTPAKTRAAGLAILLTTRLTDTARSRPGLPARRESQRQLYVTGEYNHKV